MIRLGRSQLMKLMSPVPDLSLPKIRAPAGLERERSPFSRNWPHQKTEQSSEALIRRPRLLPETLISV